MSIEFSYQIVSVDAQARCMEVVYAAEGHQTMHIGARLPFVGESLEDVIKMYAPIPLWLEAQMEVVVPDVGSSGTVIPPAPEPTVAQDQAVVTGADSL